VIPPDLAGALTDSPTIEITTHGARSGRPSRIEIWAWSIDGRFVITGTPGPRDWLVNLRADPSIVVHAAGADFHGRAREISDPGFRRRVFTDPETAWYLTQCSLGELVDMSPMIEVEFAG
jgi:deazaflavin-dependent oxidoreductase (nitroreductase family)